jgi:hypothetical protein
MSPCNSRDLSSIFGGPRFEFRYGHCVFLDFLAFPHLPQANAGKVHYDMTQSLVLANSGFTFASNNLI